MVDAYGTISLLVARVSGNLMQNSPGFSFKIDGCEVIDFGAMKSCVWIGGCRCRCRNEAFGESCCDEHLPVLEMLSVSASHAQLYPSDTV